MTDDIEDLGLAANTGGPEAPAPEPIWILVRATVNLQGLPRDHVATVDVTDPYIQDQLRATWIVPLPASQQPTLTTDPTTFQPTIKEEAPMTVQTGRVNFSEEKAPALIDHQDDGNVNAVAFPQVSNESDGTVAGQPKHINNIAKGTEPGTYE